MNIDDEVYRKAFETIKKNLPSKALTTQNYMVNEAKAAGEIAAFVRQFDPMLANKLVEIGHAMMDLSDKLETIINPDPPPNKSEMN